MAMTIRGIDVKLAVRAQTGTDGFDRPTYETVWETVGNVLVGSPSSEDVINEMNLSGRRIAYTLAIPKGDTHDWNNAEVEFFGEKFRTVGIPIQGIDENIPLSWNKKVQVERYG
jgi:hypothetical protein